VQTVGIQSAAKKLISTLPRSYASEIETFTSLEGCKDITRDPCKEKRKTEESDFLFACRRKAVGENGLRPS